VGWSLPLSLIVPEARHPRPWQKKKAFRMGTSTEYLCDQSNGAVDIVHLASSGQETLLLPTVPRSHDMCLIHIPALAQCCTMIDETVGVPCHRGMMPVGRACEPSLPPKLLYHHR
jgi:hypothetical protein